jgi:hypothetical protein
VQVEWSNEQSEHALLYLELHINEEIVMGPGLTRINADVLNDAHKLGVTKEEIKEMLAQTPDDWNPHKN